MGRGRRWSGVVLAAFLLVGCSGGDRRPEAAPARSTTADGRDPGTRVLDRLRGAVAVVETPLGSGTAVLLESGHLVTNAHVVDPFATVEVRFEDDAEPQAVAVRGVDLDADLAVLDRIDRPGGVAMASAAGLDAGADLYLVGFPGDPGDAEATLARGVLSRRRELPEWDLHLVQTDAAIGEGQSGGALATGDGRVVGISGFSLDDAFALALDGADVSARVEALLDGDGHELDLLPAPGAYRTTGGVVRFEDGLAQQAIHVPERDGGEEGEGLLVSVDAPGKVGVEVRTADGSLVALDTGAAAGGAGDEDGPEPTEEEAPGRWRFDVAPDEPVLVRLVALGPDVPPTVEVTTDRPAAAVADGTEPQDIDLGDAPVGVVAGWQWGHAYVVDLEAGQVVEVEARSALGDPAFLVYASDDPSLVDEEADDGGGGLFDLDATTTFTAPADGRYEIDVYSADGYSLSYRLEVDG